PSIAVGLGGTRQRISNFGPQQTGGIYYNNNNVDLNLSWEIDLWGRLYNYSSAALAEAEASSADYAATRLSLAAQTAKSWFNYKEAAAQEELAQSAVINHEKNLAAIESGYKLGIRTGLELREMRTRAADAAANLSSRKRLLDQAARRLEILLGRYPSASLAKATDLPALPAPIPAGLPSELLLRRPDLIAAERRLVSSDQTLRAAKKDRLPKLSLTSSVGTSTSEFDDLLDNNFRVGAVAGNLINPIFQGGRIRANIDRRESLKEQSIANYHNTALRAFLEVETALAGENLLRVEARHLMLATNAAKDSLMLARQQYQSGSISFTNMLQSERSALATLSRYLVAHRNLLNNRIDLHLALGGSFDNE
ncbi:MAG: efflux transporter outer membrane subunit, partial [Verrucomicrobiota bacterium]|nr:efflux transporter outer membrane subunit [Verrucomicrobiota bacterium]